MNRTERRSAIRENRFILDLLRRHSNADRSELASISGVSWPTIDKILKNVPRFETDEIIKFLEDGSFVSHTFGQFLGISVEPTNIRASCVGLDFKPTSYTLFNNNEKIETIAEQYGVCLSDEQDGEDELSSLHTYIKHDETLSSISNSVEKTIGFFIELCDSFEHFNLLAITISIPGVIDLEDEELNIRFCPNIKALQSVPCRKIIKNSAIEIIESHDIFLSFEHDSQAATMSVLASMNNEDYYAGVNRGKILACVMLDAGIGLCVLNNGEVIRGRGSFGELGHLRIPPNITTNTKDEQIVQKCDCGKRDCFEINFRNRILKSYTNSEFDKNTKKDELTKEFGNPSSDSYPILCNYIGHIMNILGTLLNADEIIFCGRLISNLDRLSNDLETIYLENVIGTPTTACKIIASKTNSYYISTGAAISSYFACNERHSFPKIEL